MLLAFAAFGLVTIGASLSRWQWLSMALLVGSGFTLTTAFSTLNSLVQEMAPEALRGRVLSIFGLAFRGGGPVGSLVAGGLVRSAGAPVVMAGYAALLLCVASLLLLRGASCAACSALDRREGRGISCRPWRSVPAAAVPGSAPPRPGPAR